MPVHTHTWKVILLLWFLENAAFAGKNIVPETDSDLGGAAEKLGPETKLAHHNGASRFDVSGILTAFGVKQGASIFALVLFPILFPLMILLGLALFVISLLGTSGVAAVGRRSDIVNSMGNSFGYSSLLPQSEGGGDGGGLYYNYKLGRDGSFSPISLTNREGLALNAVPGVAENDACLEKFVCELLLHYGGSKIIGTKTTFEILREMNVRPLIVPSPFTGKKSRKVWRCSGLKCNLDGYGNG